MLTNYFAKYNNAQSEVFCHGDFNLGNIIHDPATRKIGFIDFTYAGKGPRALDLAHLLYYREIPGFVEAAFHSYEDNAGSKINLQEIELHHVATSLPVYVQNQPNQPFVFASAIKERLDL